MVAKAKIININYPANPDYGADVEIEYTVSNIGDNGTIWGAIMDRDTNHDLPDSSWTEELNHNQSTTKTYTINSVTGELHLRIDVGHWDPVHWIVRDEYINFDITPVGYNPPVAEIRNLNYPSSVDYGGSAEISYDVYNTGGCPASIWGAIYEAGSDQPISGSFWHQYIECDQHVSKTFTINNIINNLNLIIKVGHIE